jgi:hypothetical protein
VDSAEHNELSLRVSGSLLGQLERVASDIGKFDDLIALVMVTEDENPVTEGSFCCTRAIDQIGVRWGGEIPGAFDSSLALGVCFLPEKEQGQWGGGWFDKRSGHSLSVALGARVHTSAGGVCHSEAG